MELRGRRRCTGCGHRWSYFETGGAACPACGSISSVSRGQEAELHTDGPADLDLGPARSALGEGSLEEPAEQARSAARDYLRARGFVGGGELLPLDDGYLAAAELSHAADHLRRTLDPGDRTEEYFLSLLAGAGDGDRPDEVPEHLRWVRGLAAADSIEAYRRDVARWLDDHPGPAARPLLDRLRSHERRVAALDGDVPVEEAGALVAAARGVGRFLRDGDGDGLEDAEESLDVLD